MKNRILSFVLALVMVLALVPATVLTSSATGDEKITFTFGNVTVTPGEVAGLDLYVEASSLPAGHTGLVDYEFFFESSEGLSPLPAPAKDGQEEKQGFITADGSLTTNGYMNESTKKMGVTGGTARVATAEAMTAKGGAYLGTIKFTVAEDVEPGTTLTVVGTALVTASYKHETNAETTKISADAEVSFKAGTITVVGEKNEGAADAVVGTGESVTIPSTNAQGQTVTSITNNIMGAFDTIYVPARIESIGMMSMMNAEPKNLVLKSTDYDAVALQGVSLMGNMLVSKQVTATVYYHKRANETDTTYDTIKTMAGIVPKNILDTTGAAPVVVGNSVSVYGAIEVDDRDYNYVTVEVSFYQNGTLIKKIESDEQTCVYTTLKYGTDVLVGTTDPDKIDDATGIVANDGTYLTGLTVTNVPAGEYQVKVVVYGSTNDVNGTPIIVCSDATEYTVTVA